MRYLLFFILLFSNALFAQNPLVISVTSVKTSDSENGYRDFDITYTFENTTEKPITFINCNYPLGLNYPEVTTLNGRLLLYENGKLESFNPIENSNIYVKRYVYLKSNLSEAEIKAMSEKYLSDFQKDSIWRKKERERVLKINDFEYVKSAVIILKPKEIRTFQQNFSWTRQRYFKTENLEFYFDDSDKYTCRLNFTFLKEEFKYFFPEV
jgi:predicted NodU family carbamoyl transferase